MKFLKILLLTSVMMIENLSGQTIIKLTSIPEDTPSDAKIFMASSLNNWNPNDENYLLKKENNGKLFIEIPEASGTVEYKFTRGSWETVEGDENGKEIHNRAFTFSGKNQVVENQIQSWQKPNEKQSTLSANVKILSENFTIPQLKSKRKIWIYLPPDYANSTKRYPVIYMEDGQNLFNEASSFSGEWKVDETLNQIFSEGKQDAIVVGIENGGSERINEYSPWKNAKYGGGKGSLYADFLANTLKPYIDRNYRTKPQPPNSALIGSSMGGLISFYTGLKYPEKFGKLGIFSPSFWFAENSLKFFANKNNKQIKNSKIYFLAGKKESDDMVADVQEMVEILKQKGISEKNVFTKFDEDGTHSESYWSREFRAAYLWLFP